MGPTGASKRSPCQSNRQFSLRALLLAVLAFACALGAWAAFGTQATLAISAAGLTGCAINQRGMQALVSPCGLAWFSGLVMLFSGFYVHVLGPMGGHFHAFAFLNYLVLADAAQLALIWLTTLSLMGFGLLVGTTAFAQIAFRASWNWRIGTTLSFLAMNAAISGLALIRAWPLTDSASFLSQICFAVSGSAILLVAVSSRLRVSELRQVALADTLAIISVFPQHVPFDGGFFPVEPAAAGPGAWMLLAGSGGLLVASAWLWFIPSSDFNHSSAK